MSNSSANAPDPAAVPSFTWVYLPLLVVSLGLFGLGVYAAVEFGQWSMLAGGSLAIVATIVTWPVAVTLGHVARSTNRRIEEHVLPVRQRLDQIGHRLTKLGEQQLLSDRAKAIAFRENDRAALRDAIREDIDKQDWEAALRLADDMDKVFGYRQEAALIRKDVLARRDDLVRRQIGDGVNTILRRCEDEDWSGAFEEADRLRRLYPGEERVERLRDDVERRREAFKQRLLAQWHEHVDVGDNDRAIALLKRLDPYLTLDEGADLEAKARQLFKSKLEDYRQKFGAAVHEQRWHDAVVIGEEITGEFPNTQMAREVREKMPVLIARYNGDPVPVGA